jgi:transcription elongation factor Elf1
MPDTKRPFGCPQCGKEYGVIVKIDDRAKMAIVMCEDGAEYAPYAELKVQND